MNNVPGINFAGQVDVDVGSEKCCYNCLVQLKKFGNLDFFSL